MHFQIEKSAQNASKRANERVEGGGWRPKGGYHLFFKLFQIFEKFPINFFQNKLDK